MCAEAKKIAQDRVRNNPRFEALEQPTHRVSDSADVNTHTAIHQSLQLWRILIASILHLLIEQFSIRTQLSSVGKRSKALDKTLLRRQNFTNTHVHAFVVPWGVLATFPRRPSAERGSESSPVFTDCMA
ncbi:unnamed protein product [Ectocarpus fasciculatus]